MTVLLPSGVAGANLPLVLAVVAAAGVYIIAHPKWRRLRSLERLASAPSRRINILWTLLFAFSALVVLGIALEKYHRNGCPNSAVFQFEIDSLARWVYDFAARQRVPYWLVFGNILFVLRGDVRIPVGDTDSDVAMEKTAFFATFPSIDEFTRRAKVDAAMELQRDVYVVYHVERELIQVFLTSELVGSHADIWLYRTEEDAGTKFLVNTDRTIRAHRIPYEQIMPLREKATQFLGTAVTLPRHPEFLAQAEYGASFMTPLTTRLECMENYWNGYAFYKAPRLHRQFVGLMLFTSAALTLALAYLLLPLRRVLFQPHTKLKASRAQPSSTQSSDPMEMHSFLEKAHV